MSQPSPDRESLRNLLVRVHERLSEAGSVDAGSRELLREVMGDIERALHDRQLPSSAARSSIPAVAPTAQTHTPRLESLAVQFEAGHPALADLLRQLVDLLGKAGI